ncbi:hypothetical protein [Pontibacter chitinilyticus]|uniref:hypothetical protein n=1 Tax=Pontibacter chitinilyticus TaxID=2674989 RepID=UPI00321B9A7F
MKNKLSLFLLFFPLLLVGCQHPDDDVDFPRPEPQKLVSELILGKWYQYAYVTSDATGQETTQPTGNYLRYDISENNISILSNREGMDQGGGDYTLKDSGGRTYLELNDFNLLYEIYEIKSITDSTMTWEVNDSLSQLWFSPVGPHQLKFRKRIKHPLEDKIMGYWDTDSTIKVMYDTAGKVIKKEGVANNTSSFNFGIDWMEVSLPATGGYYEGGWSLKDSDGKTYLTYSADSNKSFPATATYQVVSVSNNKMVWERKESPTVSYLVELNNHH